MYIVHVSGTPSLPDPHKFRVGPVTDRTAPTPLRIFLYVSLT